MSDINKLVSDLKDKLDIEHVVALDNIVKSYELKLASIAAANVDLPDMSVEVKKLEASIEELKEDNSHSKYCL